LFRSDSVIKGIIFDIGGVLVDVKIKAFLANFVREAGLSKEQLYTMIIMGSEWEKFEKGLITEEQLKEKVEKGHGIKPELMDKMADGWRRSIKPKKDTLEIVKKLHGRYKLFALSNVDENTTKKCFHVLDFYDLFDEIILSWKVHMRKPEPEIYKYTLKKMGLKPQEVVFIDNYPANLPNARKMGIHTILFEGAEELVEDLASLGIDLKK
jgi:epoxide hydrolase-like predicted phosphatase